MSRATMSSSSGECVLAGDAARFARMLDGLQGEGAAPPLVLWAIAEEARALLHVLNGQDAGRPLQQLLREARVWGARAELMPKALRRFTRRQLEDALLHAARRRPHDQRSGQGRRVGRAAAARACVLARPRGHAVESR